MFPGLKPRGFCSDWFSAALLSTCALLHATAGWRALIYGLYAPAPAPARAHTHTHIPGDWRVEGSPYLGKHVAIYLENVLRVSCFRERDGGGG